MNYEEEKYPTLPPYENNENSHNSNNINIYEERQRLMMAVSELDKIKAEMELRIRKEYEDKLLKEQEERKEKEEYIEFQKDFESLIESLNIDQRSKNLIEHINKVLKEVPVFILYNRNIYDDIQNFICITNTNVYRVYAYGGGKSDIYPLYRFNKKLTLNECKFLFSLLKQFLYRHGVVPNFTDINNTFRYITDGINHEERYISGYNIIKRSKQIENIIKLFPGKYDYNGFEKIDDDIFQNSSLLINKKDMKISKQEYYIVVPL